MLHMGKAREACDKRDLEPVSYYEPDELLYVYNRKTGCTYPLFKRRVIKWIKEDKLELSQ